MKERDEELREIVLALGKKEKLPINFLFQLRGSLTNGKVEEFEDFLDLASGTPNSEIEIKIASPGGTLDAALNFVRLMEQVPNPIRTVATTDASSGASLILAMGDKGKRFAYEDTRIIIHQTQFSGLNFDGSAPELFKWTKDWLRINREFVRYSAKAVGLPVSKWIELTKEDRQLTAQQAVEIGLIDHVLPIKRRGNVR